VSFKSYFFLFFIFVVMLNLPTFYGFSFICTPKRHVFFYWFALQCCTTAHHWSNRVIA